MLLLPLFFVLAVLTIQVQMTDTENLFIQVYAQSLPTINPGDILVVLDGIASGQGIVIVDPITGLQTFLVKLIEFPTDIKVDSAGELILSTDNGVWRLDPITGIQTEIANAGDAFLDSPIGLDLNAAGDIIVIDDDGLGNGIVVKIDPVSGMETLITSEPTLAGSSALAIEPSGDIIVLNVEDLFRINPTSGITTLLTSGVPAEKIVINDAGDIFAGGSEVVKINPTTGIATEIASGFDIITGIGVESDGNIIVVETGGITTIHRVNPDTGVQAIVSSGNLLTGTEAITLTVFLLPPIDPDPDDDGTDHYLGYKVKETKHTDKFQKFTVTLSDQFETDVIYTVKKPEILFNPVDKNQEGIIDEMTHLLGYKIKAPKGEKFEKVTNVHVTNQFGNLILDVKKPKLLLVPSSKDLIETPNELESITVNHYKCYDVKETKGTPKFVKRQVTLSDPNFGETKVFEVKKPKQLCTPVDKNGEGIIDPVNHLMCYDVKKLKGEPKFVKRSVFTKNQFGTEELDVKKEHRFCVPSLKILELSNKHKDRECDDERDECEDDDDDRKDKHKDRECDDERDECEDLDDDDRKDKHKDRA